MRLLRGLCAGDVSSYLMVSAKALCRNITCKSIPGSPPPFLFFIGARGLSFEMFTSIPVHTSTHDDIQVHTPVQGNRIGFTIWVPVGMLIGSHTEGDNKQSQPTSSYCTTQNLERYWLVFKISAVPIKNAVDGTLTCSL